MPDQPVRGPGPLGPPIFSGGTGRSGTTVIAKLLDRHPLVGRTVPWEARFLTDRFGLCSVVQARLRGPAGLPATVSTGSLRIFERRMRGRWYRRRAGNDRELGLFHVLAPEELERALAGFRSALPADPASAAAALTHELLDGSPRSRGRERWIETTPDNALRAHQLVRIFPDLKLLHMVRDGRDTAASVASRYWGPDRLPDALHWWERRTLAIHRSISRLPPERVLTVQLEDLVLHRREETLARVLEFLELPPHPAVLRFHAEQMRPQDAHLQRWRDGLEPAEVRRLEARYEAAVDRLRRGGVPLPRQGEGRSEVTAPRGLPAGRRR